jgi:hypothetical protein
MCVPTYQVGLSRKTNTKCHVGHMLYATGHNRVFQNCIERSSGECPFSQLRHYDRRRVIQARFPNREHTCKPSSFTISGNMKTTTENKLNKVSTVAPRIAGEDIVKGDYITLLSEIIEFPSFLWSCSSISPPIDEPVRTRWLPHQVGTKCEKPRIRKLGSDPETGLCY